MTLAIAPAPTTPRRSPQPPSSATSVQAALCADIREHARAVAQREPLLSDTLLRLFAHQPSFADMLAGVLAHRLAGLDLNAEDLHELLLSLLGEQPEIADDAAADMLAVCHRDPAAASRLHVIFNLKGYQALQTHRASHRLWSNGRHELALAIANRASLVFGVDIHPAARIGRGVMLDHGTGIVIGETACVDEDVSIMQGVTLGGTGKEHGDRHPKIRRGVLLGAGAKVLGNIEIGAMSKVAAGSIVLKNVPSHVTVAGVPAKVVRVNALSDAPALQMDQGL